MKCSYRYVMQFLSLVALLMISSANTCQPGRRIHIQKQAGAVYHSIDCACDSRSGSGYFPAAAGCYDFYIGNRNTKAFHSPFCAILPPMGNRIYFRTCDEAIAAGYWPCSECSPL